MKAEATLNNKDKCQSTSKLSWSLPSSLSAWFSMLVPTSRLNQVRARVNRALAAIRPALKSNQRTFIGLLLIAVAPIVEVAYSFFTRTPVPHGSYWTTYWFLFAIRSDMSTILYATGFFLLMPEFSKAKLIAIVPVAYKTAKIIFMAFVTNDAQFHSHITFSFILYGIAIGSMWLFIAEYLVNLHFHKRSRPIATAQAVLRSDHLDNETKIRLVLNEINTYQALK